MLFGSSDTFCILFDTMFGLCGSIFGIWDCLLCAVVKSEDELCNVKSKRYAKIRN